MRVKIFSRYQRMLIAILYTGMILFSGCTPNSVVATKDFVKDPNIHASITATSGPTLQPKEYSEITTYGSLTMVVPQELASGITGSEYPRVDSEDAAWWQKTPGHLQVMLNDYILQSKSHPPQVYVYPAQDYAKLVSVASESIKQINDILIDPNASISSDQLPSIPFCNDKQVFASNIKFISFQNGKGVRFLTQYALYPAPVNNDELFYQFQGLTNDGAYYIIAIMPITAPDIADANDSAISQTLKGIAYPDMADPNADWKGYYNAAVELLNTTSPDAFTPEVNILDMLIQSFEISR